MQLAEATAERHVLFVGDVLIPKEEDEVLEQSSVQRAEDLVVERFTQIHTVHLRADVAGERPELDNVVSHFPLRLCTNASFPAIMRKLAWRRQ